MARSILVIAAHPDDEVLGCGATIAKHILHGDTVNVLVIADGVSSRFFKPWQVDENIILNRQNLARRANELLGVNHLSLLRYPDNRLDTVALLEIIQEIEREMDTLKPDIVYTHHRGDLNVDHSIVHDAVLVACRPIPHNSVRTVLFFEIPSSSEWAVSGVNRDFRPSWFVDVSATLQLKLDALKVYNCEMHEFPHPRSVVAVEYLARWRGSTVGVMAAEAFQLGRHKDFP